MKNNIEIDIKVKYVEVQVTQAELAEKAGDVIEMLGNERKIEDVIL